MLGFEYRKRERETESKSTRDREKEREEEKEKHEKKGRMRYQEMRNTYEMLTNGERQIGGNWSAHCISTWTWITICFVVC